MQITFEKKILRLFRHEVPATFGLTVGALCAIIGTDTENNSYEYEMLVGLPHNATSFVPWEQLTEEQVIAWIDQQVGHLYPTVEAYIEKQLNNIRANLTVTTDLPWLVPNVS
jgi:hypothetical protein